MIPVSKQIGAVVLAAGRGTRLGCTDIPKVMLELNGRPMVDYTVKTLERMGFLPENIVLVVGFQKDKVIEYFGNRVRYAHQIEQLGTAHAAFTGMCVLPELVDQVLVMGGDDSAFYTPETLGGLIDHHRAADRRFTLLSSVRDNPGSLGRVVRSPGGRIDVIEKESLTDEHRKSNEISTGTFVFDRHWFERIFPTMPKIEKLGEYGLPMVFTIAREQGLPFDVMKLENQDEWFGVNTPEELAEARKRKE